MATRKTKGTWGGWRPGAGRKPALKDRRRVTFEIESADLASLRVIAERRDITVSEAIRRAIRAYLKRHKRDS